MKIVIVKKTGVLGELDWKKNVDLNSIYKKCGFRKNTDFEKRHTWKINNSEYISLYAKNNGRANTENKYDLPPPIDTALYFGSLAIIRHSEEVPTNDNCEDLSGEEWKTIREKLFGGFEDIDEDEEESEEEYVDPKDLTKQGYKKDGFVVDDNTLEFNSDSEEDEEWIPSQEENTEDSLEEDDEEELEQELEGESPDDDEEEEEEEEEETEEEVPEFANDSNDELEEEEYEY